MPISPEELQDTHLFEKAIWRLLARGAVDAKHAYRLCSIATVNEEGKPDTRMVVLRECYIPKKSLSFHTDIRSGKVSQFNLQPDVCMLFWDPKQSMQLRVYGKAVIHHLDEMTKQQISSLPAQQIALYGYSAKPGSMMEQEKESNFDETLIVQNFAWVRVSVHTLDALHLGRNGVHTRIQFSYDGEGLPTAKYLQP
jgi:pyridoxamine 5'-phosphate oxidase